MLVFDGPDRCGKGTAMKVAVSTLAGWGYHYNTKPPVPPFRYFGRFLAAARPEVVVDRLHWSEKVYAEVYRNGPELTAHQWRLVELMLLAQRARIVLMTDLPDAIRSRWSEAEMHAPGGIESLVKGFDELYHGQSAEPYRSRIYPYRATLPELVHDGKPTDMFLGFLGEEEESSRIANLLPSPYAGIGYTYGNGFVILGEAISHTQHDASEDPALPWDRGPAADLLWQCLDQAGIRWGSGYYTNVAAFKTRRAFEETMAIINPRVIVALGVKAKEYLYEADVGTSKAGLAHPSYIQRFQAKEKNAYARDLQQCLRWFQDGEDL